MDGVLPDRVLQAAGGGWAAAALASALELGVFAELGRGPRSRAQLCRRLGLDPAAGADFLDALVGLQMLERDGDGERALYLNSREAGAFLDPRSPGYLGTLLGELPQAAQLSHRLRGGAPLPADADAQAAWSRATGQALAAEVDFSGVHEVGVAHGQADAMACALVQALPPLRAWAALPAGRRAGARARIAAMGLADRVRCVAAEAVWPAAELVVVDGLPARSRAATLRRAVALLQGGPGRRLALVERLVDPARRRSALVLLQAAGGARGPAPWTEAALRSACMQAGLQPRTLHALAGGACAVVATV